MCLGAASLTDSLEEVSRAYQAKRRNKVRLNFGASGDLARQIEQGAPVDIFFSADLAKMDILEKKGLIDSTTRRNLLSNQLVFVVPIDSITAIRAVKDLLRPAVKRIAVAQPESAPIGIYTKKYLDSEGAWKDVASKIVPVLDVKATLAAVEAGNVDGGFVYKTDAALSKQARVAFAVPIEKGPKITYPIALVKESKERAAAADFMSFLASSAGKRVFKKYGFVVLE